MGAREAAGELAVDLEEGAALRDLLAGEPVASQSHGFTPWMVRLASPYENETALAVLP